MLTEKKLPNYLTRGELNLIRDRFWLRKPYSKVRSPRKRRLFNRLCMRANGRYLQDQREYYRCLLALLKLMQTHGRKPLILHIP